VQKLVEDTPSGFPWLVIAGKTLAGWLVIDMDATLITAYRQGRSGCHLEERLRLPSLSKTWQVNCGWVLAANIAADLAAWSRLLGFHDCADLSEAEPDTLRCRVWHLPARLVHHARLRILKISPRCGLVGRSLC
jgi:hypothetical protein